MSFDLKISESERLVNYKDVAQSDIIVTIYLYYLPRPNSFVLCD